MNDFSKLNAEAERLSAEQDVQKLRERNVYLEARNKELEITHKGYLLQRGGQQDYIDQIIASVIGAEPYPHVPYKGGPKSDNPMSAVLKLSDWQIGEFVSPQETEGFGGFNWAMAQSMILDQLAPKFLDWIGTHRTSFQIDDLHLLELGDFISGDIHQELLVTNEFPAPVQTSKAGFLLGEITRRLAPHFRNVYIWQVGADNHGRLTKKPQAKQKALNNFNHLVYTIANQYIDGHKNVHIQTAEGMKMVAEISGWRFLLEHGDTVKMNLGTPYYGLERERGREATKRMRSGKEFDYMAIGHFHQPAIVAGNILVNGALTGTSEFDHSMGRHAEPAQVSFLVHPRYGLFDWTPWQFKREV